MTRGQIDKALENEDFKAEVDAEMATDQYIVKLEEEIADLKKQLTEASFQYSKVAMSRDYLERQRDQYLAVVRSIGFLAKGALDHDPIR